MFYPTGYNYKVLIKLVETQKEEHLADLTPKLLGKWPNTYAFTKQVAEDAARQEGEGLPYCIYRPAIGKFGIRAHV